MYSKLEIPEKAILENWSVPLQTADGVDVRMQLRKINRYANGILRQLYSRNTNPVISSSLILSEDEVIRLDKARVEETKLRRKFNLNTNAPSIYPYSWENNGQYFVKTAMSPICDPKGEMLVEQKPFGFYNGVILQNQTLIIITRDAFDARLLNEKGLSAIAPPSVGNTETFRQAIAAFEGHDFIYYMENETKDRPYFESVHQAVGQTANSCTLFSGEKIPLMVFHPQFNPNELLETMHRNEPLSKPAPLEIKRAVGRPKSNGPTGGQRFEVQEKLYECLETGMYGVIEIAREISFRRDDVMEALTLLVEQGCIIPNPRPSKFGAQTYRLIKPPCPQ